MIIIVIFYFFPYFIAFNYGKQITKINFESYFYDKQLKIYEDSVI